MRSSKSRSRSKSNRSRSVGNIVNRVFDSSGPEGKVRGTPQQIIDKYNQLARDAQLSGDRVATENFQQHSEHYTRMLAEAQREQDARREQQDREHRERQQQQQGDQRDGHDDRGDDRRDRGDQPRADRGDPSRGDQSEALNDVIDVGGESDSGLVETPESKSSKPRGRRPRKPRRDGEPAAEDSGTPEAAE